MTGVLIVAAVGFGGAGAASAQPSQPSHGGNARQDCRTYSSVTECGHPRLDQKQWACVTWSVGHGMTERRAAVECRAFE
ncbi:hypothetical protein [Actinomadura rugatobispora]|uniref:Uncharacterized protein n=1 Tax=Actinomadura rugatobispora TaxID=1994 RepID=A0ABW1AI27_9ACTN